MNKERLEQIRGFMNYVSRTYRWVVPYIKGLHLTIDSRREVRDSEGWKVLRPAKRLTMWEWVHERWIDVQPEEFDEMMGKQEKAQSLSPWSQGFVWISMPFSS